MCLATMVGRRRKFLKPRPLKSGVYNAGFVVYGKSVKKLSVVRKVWKFRENQRKSIFAVPGQGKSGNKFPYKSYFSENVLLLLGIYSPVIKENRRCAATARLVLLIYLVIKSGHKKGYKKISYEGCNMPTTFGNEYGVCYLGISKHVQ